MFTLFLFCFSVSIFLRCAPLNSRCPLLIPCPLYSLLFLFRSSIPICLIFALSIPYCLSLCPSISIFLRCAPLNLIRPHPIPCPLCSLVYLSLYSSISIFFMCSHINLLNSFSVRATSNLNLRSISANSVANVLPVSRAFFVPFCIDITTSSFKRYLNYVVFPN